MSSYFKDPVQAIKNNYPHPVEQFIVLSREGHHDAANRLIGDYAARYREGVNKVFADFVSGKKHGFDWEDEKQVEENLCKEFSNQLSSLYTSSMTLEEAEEACTHYASIIKESIEAAREKYLDSRFKITSREYLTLPKHEQNRLIDETRVLEDKIKLLSLFLTTAESLSPVNNKEPDATVTPIPNGGCMVM